jgi:hypothetical protein
MDKINIDEVLKSLAGRRKSKYTDDIIREILEYVNEHGITLASKHYKISSDTIRNWCDIESNLKKYAKRLNTVNIESIINNINFDSPFIKYKEKQIREILQDVNLLGITKACKKHNMHKGQIHYWCERRLEEKDMDKIVKESKQVKVSKLGRNSNHSEKEIQEFLISAEKIGIKKTCKKYNITPGVISYWRNVEKRRERALESYKAADKEKIKSKQKEWRENNTEHIKQYNKTYYPSYSKEWLKDPVNKLIKHQRVRLFNALKYQEVEKKTSCLKYLGCTIKEFHSYIEEQFSKGMTWENWGNNGWHIDHIKPCSLFDLSDISEQKKCFHFTNTQPMWSHENISKNNKQQNILAIINCASKKKDFACTASEMYQDSKIFKCMESYVSTLYPEYKIISAKHGLINPADIISPYEDVVMHVPNNLLHSDNPYKKLSAKEKKTWAKNIIECIDFDKYDEVRFYCGMYYKEYIVPISNDKCKFYDLPQGHGRVISKYNVWM